MTVPRITLAAALTAAMACTAVMAANATVADDRPFPVRIFSSTSPFTQKLPAATPAAPDSATLVSGLVKMSHDYYGTPTWSNVDINVNQFAPTMYVARNSDPVAVFHSTNCQGKSPGWDTELLRDHLSGIHIPAGAKPDTSTDGAMVVYNPDADTVTETWVTTKNADGSWNACWGGTIRNASTAIGQHSGYHGVSGSGLSLAAYTIRASELKAGYIGHVVSLSIPLVKQVFSWPAVRTDGDQVSALAEGQMLRLPKSLDIDAMKLSPSARAIAHAAQDFGVMITDRSGALSFAAENGSVFATNPYVSIFRGRWGSQEMSGDPSKGEQAFPLDKLVALPMNYRVPTSGTPTPAPVPGRKAVDVRQVARFWNPAVDASGTVWAARKYGTFDTNNENWHESAVQRVTGTSVPQVYASSVWAQTQYSAVVPNGTYDVTLYQAEDWCTRAGCRVFDVNAEGVRQLTGVDIFAKTGGQYRALESTFPVTVRDGRLDLQWVARTNYPLVNAIRIASR